MRELPTIDEPVAVLELSAEQIAARARVPIERMVDRASQVGASKEDSRCRPTHE